MLFEGRIYVSTKLFYHKDFDSISLFLRKYIIAKYTSNNDKMKQIDKNMEQNEKLFYSC